MAESGQMMQEEGAVASLPRLPHGTCVSPHTRLSMGRGVNNHIYLYHYHGLTTTNNYNYLYTHLHIHIDIFLVVAASPVVDVHYTELRAKLLFHLSS